MKTPSIAITANGVKVQIGTHATSIIGSDRYPFEVVRLIDEKTIAVRRLKPVVTKAAERYGDTPEFAYESDPNSGESIWRLVVRKGAERWLPATKINGRWVPSEGYWITFGKAVYYQDPSF